MSDRGARERRRYEDIARTWGEAAQDDFAGAPKPARSADALTLDTNLILDYWRQRPRMWAIERLLDLARKGAVELVVTRYIEADIPRSPLREHIAKLGTIGKTGGLFTLGVSALGGGDLLGSDAFLQCQTDLKAWRPSKGKAPDDRDWSHLHAHYVLRRDYFLTWDEPLLELGSILEAGFPLGVCAPDDYLAGRATSE